MLLLFVGVQHLALIKIVVIFLEAFISEFLFALIYLSLLLDVLAAHIVSLTAQIILIS